MITKNLALAVAAILVAGTDAQEPDCDAEAEACEAVPECFAIMESGNGSCGDAPCEVVFDATGAETGECSGGQSCIYVAGATEPERYAALLGNTEGAAFLACESSGDPCGEEAIACVAVPECFAVLESGQGSCGDAPCEKVLVPGVMVFDPSAETGECSGGEFLETGECTYIAGASAEAVGAALLGSTEGTALASCRATSSGHSGAHNITAGTGAQEPDCGAAVEACAAVPECQAILMDSPRDGSCGDAPCEVVFDANGAETGECSGGQSCAYVAGVTVPEWYAALLEYTEGAAFLACLTSGDPCGEEAIACVAVPECFTVLESGQGSCGDAPCEMVLDDAGAETGECSGGESCIYVAGASAEAVGAALLGSTEGAALASCRAPWSGHPDAQRCSAWSGDCPEGQRVMAHADDRECGTQ